MFASLIIGFSTEIMINFCFLFHLYRQACCFPALFSTQFIPVSDDASSEVEAFFSACLHNLLNISAELSAGRKAGFPALASFFKCHKGLLFLGEMLQA